MAAQKKGCGFLITAFILFIVGGLIAGYLGSAAFTKGKKFVDEFETTGTSFVTPEEVSYAPDEDSAVTIWVTGEMAQSDIDKVFIHVTDGDSKTALVASKPSETGTIGNRHLVATFVIKEGETYKLRASGIEDGRHMTIAAISLSSAISFFGMVLGAMASLFVFGVLALIFGIIGLVAYLGSKGGAAQTPPVAAQ